MLYEVEQKFRVDDFTFLTRQLQERGIELQPPTSQRDRYFAHPLRNFAETDEALRLRCAGDEIRITYKGPKIDAVTKTRQEIELPLAGGEQATVEDYSRLLIALGFSPVAEVCKTRAAANLSAGEWQAELALDDVQNVGLFAELEIAAEEASLDSARQALVVLAESLGLKNIERRSYLEMLLAGKNISE